PIRCPDSPNATACWSSARRSWRRPRDPPWTCCCSIDGGESVSAPGWPAVLRDGPVILRPYRRGDGRAWSALRRANEAWLSPWEPTLGGNWQEMNSPLAYRALLRELRRAAREGTAMPFAVWYAEGKSERMVGQLSIGNIVRRAFCSGHAGYWVDVSAAGRGVIPTALALATDHAFRYGGPPRREGHTRAEDTPRP